MLNFMWVFLSFLVTKQAYILHVEVLDANPVGSIGVSATPKGCIYLRKISEVGEISIQDTDALR